MTIPNRPLSAKLRKAYKRKLLPGEDVNDISTLSIHRLARVFSRERLLVQPRKWTARHLELLRCVFTENTQQPPGAQNEIAHKYFPSQGTPDSWSANKKLPDGPPRNWGKDLVDVCYNKQDVMRQLLESFSFKEMGVFLRFETEWITVLGDGFSSPPSPLNGLMFSVVHIDLSVLQHECFYSSKRWSRQGKLSPGELSPNPYITALIIAQAQRSRSRGPYARLRLGISNEDTFHKVHVLTSEKASDSGVHVYTAFVNDAVVDRFLKPWKPPGPSHLTNIEIRHTRLPYKPYETFHTRLMTELYSGHCGVGTSQGTNVPEHSKG